MTAINYIFRADKNPTNKELHCLWATLTDKAHLDQHGEQFRVYANGKQVHIVTQRAFAQSDVVLASNQFKFLRTQEQALFNHKEGQFVRIQGEMSYSVHNRASNKDECPVDAFGRVKPHLKESFLRYLEKATGLAVADANADQVSFAWESREAASGPGKVWLNDVITFSIAARVANAEALNALAVSAIGRRKSYGLGTVIVAEAPQEANALRDEQKAF